MSLTRIALAVALCVYLTYVAHAATINGTVTDQAGKPVAGADVWLEVPGLEGPTATKTDADGAFRLVQNARVSTDPTVTAIATAAGLSVAWKRLAKEGEAVEFVLSPEAPISSRAVDEAGKPIPNARITVGYVGPPRDLLGTPGRRPAYLGGSPAMRTTTDAAGKAILPHVPPGQATALVVEADGFASYQSWRGDAPPPVAGQTAEHTIRPQRAAVIEGLVTNNGQPVAKARVIALRDDTNSQSSAEKTTDEQGHYRFASLIGSTYTLTVDAGPELLAPPREKVEAKAGQVLTGMDFALTPGGIIEGRVVDAETKQPLLQATVFAYNAGKFRGFGEGRPVGEEGKYRLHVLPGRVIVEYRGDAPDHNWQPAWPRGRPLNPFAEVEVAEGQTVRAADIAVPRVQATRLIVRDTDGKPVSGAEVRGLGLSYRGTDPTTTDEQGCASIAMPHPDDPITFIVSHRERRLAGATDLQPEQYGQTIVVPVGPCGTLTMSSWTRTCNPLQGCRWGCGWRPSTSTPCRPSRRRSRPAARMAR